MSRDDLYAVVALLGDLDRVLNPLPRGELGRYSVDPSLPPPLPPVSPAGGGAPPGRRTAAAGSRGAARAISPPAARAISPPVARPAPRPSPTAAPQRAPIAPTPDPEASPMAPDRTGPAAPPPGSSEPTPCPDTSGLDRGAERAARAALPPPSPRSPLRPAAGRRPPSRVQPPASPAPPEARREARSGLAPPEARREQRARLAPPEVRREQRARLAPPEARREQRARRAPPEARREALREHPRPRSGLRAGDPTAAPAPPGHLPPSRRAAPGRTPLPSPHPAGRRAAAGLGARAPARPDPGHHTRGGPARDHRAAPGLAAAIVPPSPLPRSAVRRLDPARPPGAQDDPPPLPSHLEELDAACAPAPAEARSVCIAGRWVAIDPAVSQRMPDRLRARLARHRGRRW